MPAELQVLHGAGDCGLIMTEELKISELPPLSPVPSGELPISQMHGTARVTCKATVQELVQSVAPRAHSHTLADIGLGNVNNTSDASKPVSGPTATAIADALQGHVNATNPHEQYATTAQVTQIVTAQAGGLAPVQSVNGQQGAVTITKASIGLSNVDNTSDANKPVSTLQQAAIDQKVDKNQARFDGRIHEKLNPLGSVAGSASVNLANGSYVTATATGACTWTFSGTLASYATAFTLQLENGGLGAQGFPATPMGAAPTLQSAGVDVLVFVHDGAAWRYAKAGA